MQVVVLHKDVGVGLGFSLAGGVDQNKPVTVREKHSRFLLKHTVSKCVNPQSLHVSLGIFFSGSQGVSLRCRSPGRLHKGRGPGLVNQRHIAVWLHPLGGPKGPEEGKVSGFGGGGPEERRDQQCL